MTTTKDIIKELIEKINENTDEDNSKYKELNAKEIQTLLNEIDDELVELEDNAEKSQKEVVSKKVEELRGEVDKINKKWKWGRVKYILEENVKSGLEELKKEIEELEKPLQVVPFKAENLSLIVPENRTDSEELVAWKKFFRGQSPEVVYGHVEGLENYFVKTNSAHSSLKEKNQVVDKFNNLDVQELSESITKSSEMYMKLAKQVGDSSGLGLFVTPAASAVAAAATVTHGVIVAGAVVGTSIYETTRKGAENITGKAMDNAKDLIETSIKIFDVGGAARNIAGSIGKDIKETEIARETARVKVAQAEAQGRVERIEDLEKQLETLRKEKDNQIKEIKEEREKDTKSFNERIQKKEKKIEDLEEDLREVRKELKDSQNKLFAQIEVTKTLSPSGQ